MLLDILVGNSGKVVAVRVQLICHVYPVSPDVLLLVFDFRVGSKGGTAEGEEIGQSLCISWLALGITRR